ncbi:MAG: HAD family hydrolase [Candidatus Aenigmarchaeota archaeon]|nr:HAD family hydrolase [Candidatus Aenigmarchaeota archaeon]
MPGKVQLFDMNGTIRDDFSAVLNTVNDVLRYYGTQSLTIQKYRELARPDYWEIYRELGFPDSESQNVDKLFAEFFDRYAGQTRIFPGVLDAVRKLKERGTVTGVVSNLTAATLNRHIAEYGMDGFFDVVVSREDCEESKPSPKPLLVAFNKLGIPPRQGRYVGDQTWDIIAARAAGASPIAISRAGSYHSRRMLESATPDKIIGKLPSLLY